MNSVQLTGRLTRDPDVRYTDGGSTIARFTTAVDRRFKQEDGPTADFPNCVAFGKTAEFIEKYFHKGMKIEITGRIQTGKYQGKDDRTVYTTDVIAESVSFAESKAAGESRMKDDGFGQAPDAGKVDEGFMDVADGVDDEIPF